MTLIIASNAIYPLLFPIGLFGPETKSFFFSSSTLLGIKPELSKRWRMIKLSVSACGVFLRAL